jgi:VWFA-related protein
VFKKLLLTLVALITLVSVAAMQDAGPRVEITGINASDLPTITVTANVFDSLGQPVRGLTAADFSLVGDIANLGTIVDVANITDDDLSFSVVLVIDTSSSMADLPFLAAQEAARVFVNSIGPNDPVAIYDFDTDVRLVQDFTTDKTALLSAIDSLTLGGKTALYGAGLEGVIKASESGSPRRALILLSDGSEYGGVSGVARGDALQEARERGVPVYTIGLGYGADRTYLMELAEGTNAQFFESPTPEELLGIYQGLADTLRSQYVITLQADLPADGTEYDLGLQVTTSEGTATAGGVLRAPIPVPIVRLPEIPEPIAETTNVEATVLADDPIASAEASIDGVNAGIFEEPPYSVPVDPLALAPGEHTLTFSATDENGDTGSASVDFEVAALPSQITLTTNLDVASEEVDEPLVVTVDVVGQTPVASATHSVDGGAPQEFTGDLPYILNIDPQLSSPGEHTLAVTVTNEGGQTSSAELSYTVAALPPTFGIANLEEGQVVDEPLTAQVLIFGSQTLTADVVALVDGREVVNVQDVVTADIPINPLAFAPGTVTLEVTATDGNGQSSTLSLDFEVAALAPDIIIEGLQAGETLDENRTITVGADSQTPITSVTVTLDGEEIEMPAEAPFSADLDVLAVPPGDHILSVEVETESGQSATVDVPFVIAPGPAQTATAQAQPTATRTLAPTNTARPTITPTPDTEATETQEAGLVIAMGETQQAAEAQATADAQVIAMMTNESVNATQAMATLNAEATSDAQATAAAQSTAQAQAANEQATANARATSTANVASDMATATAQAELEEQATSTAIVVFITETAEAQTTANAQAAIDSQMTADARATRNAARTATAEAEATEAAATQAALDEQATVDAEGSSTAAAEIAQVPTEVTEEATEEPAEVAPTESATPVEQETEEAATPGDEAVTRTPAATPPDVSTLTAEVVQESPPASSDVVPIVVIIAALIAVLLVVYFVLRGGRRGGV